MNTKNMIIYYDVNSSYPPGRIVVSHDCDVNTRTVEVFFRQGIIPLAISQDCTAKAAFVEQQSNILINDNVSCTVTESGSVLIPIDNLHRQGSFDMWVELSITSHDGEKVLVTPFPIRITVNGSILNEAEVTEESKGTVPELLEAAEEALAHNKDYDALDNRPQINGHVLTGNQTAEDLGITGGSEIASGTVNKDGTITFYDKNGNPLFTTTGASVIGPQGNSVTSAEILNNHLIIHIGVLQPDGTILNTPIDVGRVVGQNGADGQHGDGYTAARIDENGDLIMTEVVYPAQGSTPMTRQINLGHVVGAKGDKGDKGDPGAQGIQGESGAQGVPGTNGKDGADGYSPSAAVSKSGGTATITITDKNGTTTATVTDGAKGDKGEPGTNGTDGAKGDKGDKGDPGANGVSCTHSWSGTTLSVTSASGTSSANLKGAKGDKGDTGEQGLPGAKGDKGDKGDPGDDYVLTDADKTAIATAAAGMVSVPTKTSQLTNDSGFLTSHQSLANYYNKTEVNSMLDGKANASHTHSQYLTSADIANKADKSEIPDISGKADSSSVYTRSQLSEKKLVITDGSQTTTYKILVVI